MSQLYPRRAIGLCARVRRALVPLWAALALCVASAGAQAQAPGKATRVTPDYRQALADSQAAVGRSLADVRVRDETGKEMRLSDFAGKPLVISLVYTGCFQACPVATQFLARSVREARKALGEDRFNVVSIGFNQPFDTPAAMADFKRRNRVVEPGWYFLSPDPAQVELLTRNLGFSYEATPKGFDHVTQATIVDADGVIYRQVYGEEFELQKFVQPLKELLSGHASKSLTLENVWEKVKLYCTVYDPYSGGYRVNYSLFFEIFAGVTTLGALLWVVARELRRSSRG